MERKVPRSSCHCWKAFFRTITFTSHLMDIMYARDDFVNCKFRITFSMVHYSVVPTTIPPTWEHTKALIGPYVGTGPVLTVERLEYQRTHAHTTHSLFRAVARPPLLPADYYSAVRISSAASAFSNCLTLIGNLIVHRVFQPALVQIVRLDYLLLHCGIKH